MGVALAGCTTYFVAEVAFTTVTFCRAAVEDALYVQLAPFAQATGPVPEKAARCCMATIWTATCIAEQHSERLTASRPSFSRRVISNCKRRTS